MTNLEKFWDSFLKNRLCKKGYFGVDKVTHEPINCDTTGCISRCLFGCSHKDCSQSRIEWLYQEFNDNINWANIRQDTKVLFKNLENDTWEKGYFDNYEAYEDTIFIFADGRTSYTAKNSIAYDPKYVKLYKEEDE